MQVEMRNEKRGYILALDKDLFGNYVLFRVWYSLNSRRGGAKKQIFARESDALAAHAKVLRRRLRHGYLPVGALGNKAHG